MISVIGPTFLDIDSEVGELAIDQALPVLKLNSGNEQTKPGAAGYVASVLGHLGCQGVRLLSYVYDIGSRNLCQYLSRVGVEMPKEVQSSYGYGRIYTKTRYFHNGCLLSRVDGHIDVGPVEENACSPYVEGLIEEEFKKGVNPIIVVSDYGRGFFNYQKLRRWICRAVKDGRTVIVDPRADLEAWHGYYGATYITPNLHQYRAIRDMCNAEAGDLAKKYQIKNLIVTCGAAGISTYRQCTSYMHCAYPSFSTGSHIIDATGAGDAFVAGLAMGMSTMRTYPMDFAQATAAVACRRPSTGGFALSEVYQLLIQQRPNYSKRVSLNELLDVRRSCERNALRFGFTNGVFDMLHAGHVSSLQEARSKCDVLAVGLNTDESVRRIKPGRPVDKLQHRAAVLSALACVDFIVDMPANTPAALLGALCPDMYFKGITHVPNDELPGVENFAGMIVRTQTVHDDRTVISTTSRLEKLQMSKTNVRQAKRKAATSKKKQSARRGT